MGKVGLGRFHQVGNQVVAALELNINLGKSVLELVSQGYQAVVDKHDVDNNNCNNNQADQCGSHGRLLAFLVG